MMRYREGFSSLARIDLSSLNSKGQTSSAPAPAAVPAATDAIPEEKKPADEQPLSQPTDQPTTADSSAPPTPAAVPGAGVFPHENEQQEPKQDVPASQEPGSQLSVPQVDATADAAGVAHTHFEKEVPGPHSPAPTDASFVPTAEWIESWRSSLPIGTLVALIGVGVSISISCACASLRNDRPTVGCVGAPDTGLDLGILVR